MELSDLKRLADAAREVPVLVGPEDDPRHITLRLPTKHETNLAALRSGVSRTSDDKAAMAILQRALLVGAVVAWSGVVVADVLEGHPQSCDLLLLEPGAASLLLDAQPEWADVLGSALFEAMAERRQKQDTAAKN